MKNDENILWRAKDLNSLFLWSCPFDLQNIYDDHDGIVKKYLNKLFGDNLTEHCITHRLEQMIDKKKMNPSDMCPIYIGTGDEDSTCRFETARTFYDILKRNGFKTRLHSINGWDHLDVSFKDCTPLANFMDSCTNGTEFVGQ